MTENLSYLNLSHIYVFSAARNPKLAPPPLGVDKHQSISTQQDEFPIQKIYVIIDRSKARQDHQLQ